MITAIMKLNLDADVAEDFKVAIKAANRQPQLARECQAGLRSLAKELEEAEQPLGAVNRHRDRIGFFCSHTASAIPGPVASLETVQAVGLSLHRQAEIW